MTGEPVAVYTATPETFDALVLEPAHELVVVYFWGPQCPNCEVFAAHLDDVLRDLQGTPMRLVKVNAYAHEELATRYAVFGIPAFYLFRDGKKIGRMSEFRGRRFFVAVVREQAAATTSVGS